jgi:hypothetical protein
LPKRYRNAVLSDLEAAMEYANQSARNDAARPFFVMVANARHALNIVKSFADRGLKKVDVRDQTGRSYDLLELERLGEGIWETWPRPRWFFLTLGESGHPAHR